MSERTRLADQLSDRISAGEFAPGARLSEQELAGQVRVSRNTLREAFRLLEARRLVEYVPNKGVSVASPSIADVVDIYRARRFLEGRALAAAEATHPGVERMRAALRRGDAAVSAGDWREVGSANQAFHAAIVSLADSPRLDEMFRQLAAELRLAFLVVDDPRRMHEPFVDRNARIIDLLDSAGSAAAVDALEAYLTDAERLLLGAYARVGHR